MSVPELATYRGLTIHLVINVLFPLLIRSFASDKHQLLSRHASLAISRFSFLSLEDNDVDYSVPTTLKRIKEPLALTIARLCALIRSNIERNSHGNKPSCMRRSNALFLSFVLIVISSDNKQPINETLRLALLVYPATFRFLDRVPRQTSSTMLGNF